jgi:DNA polymerase III subunit delta
MKVDYSSVVQTEAASIFLYGTHDVYLAHKVNSLVAQLVKAKNAQTQWVDQATFLGDPSLLHNQGDLFSKASNNKIVIISDATDKSASTIEAHLESPTTGVQIIIPAMVGASIKKLKLSHEKSKNAAFVTCYLSQARDKQNFLLEMTQALGLVLSREAQVLAIQQMEDNTEAVLSALQKLPFYVEAGAEVSLADFQACMSDFREANVRPLVTKLGDRILPQVLRSYHEAKMLGAEEMNIIRSLNQHFTKLMHLKALVTGGTPVSQAMQSMRPPIFFKEQDEFIRHVTRWSEKDIVSLMKRLNTIELKIKTGYPFDTSQLWKPVFSMCKAG